MGYNTNVLGSLIIKNPLSEQALEKLQSFMGEDCRKHPEWGNTDLTWIDLEISEDKKRISWDGSEKTYDLPDKINLIIENMVKEFPDFELEGELEAYGEAEGDIWFLVIDNNKAVTYGAKITKVSKNTYTILVERNSHEGESWAYCINEQLNEEWLELISNEIETFHKSFDAKNFDGNFFFIARNVPENDINTLVLWTTHLNGYKKAFTKVDKVLEVPKIKSTENLIDYLYKGNFLK